MADHEDDRWQDFKINLPAELTLSPKSILIRSSPSLPIDVLNIAHFCAVECALQVSGERSVSWMLNAWAYAERAALARYPTVEDVLVLGQRVEPSKNNDGFRQRAVQIGWDVKADWSTIPRAMENLVRLGDELEPDMWFFDYETIHPFIDGNGRTGQILYNWLNGTLDRPEWAPNFWCDPRRTTGDGA